jgi:curved DNA-binding protein CbpA
MKDYYKILGVKREASEEEIRARWAELTKRYHPDTGGTEAGDEKIRGINEAYEILKDESARSQYDYERDLTSSVIRKHQRQERRTNLWKIIVVPGLGILVLFFVGFFLSRLVRFPALPRTVAKTEVLHEKDKGSEKESRLQTPSVKIDSKIQEKTQVPGEIEKRVLPPEKEVKVTPQESREMASLSLRKSPSEVAQEPEQKKEAKKESESKGKVAPPVVMKSERPPTKEVLKDVPKETPKPVVKETPKEAMKEIPKPAAREISKEVSKETPKRVAGEISKEVPKETPKPVAKEIPKEIKETPKPVAKEISREVPKEPPKPVASEIPKEVKEIPRPVVKEIPKDVLEETPKPVVKEIPKEIPGEVPKEVPKEIPKQVAKEIPKEVPKEVKEIPKEAREKVPEQIVKEVPKESRREAPKEAVRVGLHPGEKLTIWREEEKTASPLANQEEVKQFFSNYVDRYNQKDVAGFLSLFSPEAVQNQTDRLEAIKSIYTRFIEKSEELRYQLEGMTTKIYQQRIDVRGRFRVDQKLKKDGKEKVWKGNIRWVLVKEEGRLKIISLDYQNDKVP